MTKELKPTEVKQIMQRVAQALQESAAGISEVNEWWVVYGIAGAAERPQAKVFTSRDALDTFILERRAAQNADTEREHYLLIFKGKRLHIQKGREWQLWDGESLSSIRTARTIVPFIDHSGSLVDDVPQVTEIPEEEEEPDDPDTDLPVIGAASAADDTTDPEIQ